MAKKVIVIAGYGPGISKAVAERFGKEGFSVAIVARNAERLEAAAKDLRDGGIDAVAFPTDVSDPVATRSLVERVKAKLGPVTALHWNAYGSGGGDLTTASPDELRRMFDIPIVGFLSAVQAALPDLRAQKGAILVTNGGLGFFDDKVDAVGVQWGAMGLSVQNAAKHKAVRLLSHKLKDDGVYVGEVMVVSIVKGTAFDSGNGTLDAAVVGERFWQLFTERTERTAVVT